MTDPPSDSARSGRRARRRQRGPITSAEVAQLQALRETKALTFKTIATALGIKQDAVSRLFSGERRGPESGEYFEATVGMYREKLGDRVDQIIAAAPSRPDTKPARIDAPRRNAGDDVERPPSGQLMFDARTSRELTLEGVWGIALVSATTYNRWEVSGVPSKGSGKMSAIKALRDLLGIPPEEATRRVDEKLAQDVDFRAGKVTPEEPGIG